VSDVEQGRVVAFDARRTKNSGFIAVLNERGKPTGERIFFRNSGRRVITTNAGTVPVWATPPKPKRRARLANKRPPLGMKVAFTRTCEEDKAGVEWTPAKEFRKALTTIKYYPLYRVLEVNDWGDVGGSREVWNGNDVYELSVKFPQSNIGFDPLNQEGVVYQFEQQALGRAWRQIEDPRIPVCCVPNDAFVRFAKENARQPRHLHQLAA